MYSCIHVQYVYINSMFLYCGIDELCLIESETLQLVMEYTLIATSVLLLGCAILYLVDLM